MDAKRSKRSSNMVISDSGKPIFSEKSQGERPCFSARANKPGMASDSLEAS
jgi:hypothetical protein